MRFRKAFAPSILAALSVACGGDDPLAADAAFVHLEPVISAPTSGSAVAVRSANGTLLHEFPPMLAGNGAAFMSLRCSRAAGRVAYGNVGMTSGAGVWTHRFDGSDVRQLTAPNAAIRAAAWSPDGARLAIEYRLGGGVLSLATINADGTGFTPVTTSSSTQGGPSWSPDGREILFTVSTPFPPRAARVVDLATGAVRTIADYGVQPRWSPNGEWIAFFDGEGGGPHNIILVDRNGGNRRVLVAQSEQPTGFTWTDDGRIVYYEGLSRYVITTVDGARSSPPAGWIPHSHWCGTP